ncbi:hypothetical protein [Metabacillus sp. RGM 3146]
MDFLKFKAFFEELTDKGGDFQEDNCIEALLNEEFWFISNSNG